MADNSNSDQVTLSRAKLQALIDTIDRVKDGDYSARVDEPFGDPAMDELREHLNGVLATVEQTTEDYHERSMELAMGRIWGLDIVRLNGNRRLLGTLLIQGGLPLRAIGRDGNSLQDLFRRLLDNAIATVVFEHTRG